MDENKKIALDIINNSNYLTLATSDKDMPWASPIFYCVDKEYNFYFYSDLNSRHAENILKNSKCSLAIFNSEDPPDIVNGAQIEGSATILKDGELPRVVALYYKKRFQDKNEREKNDISFEKFLTKAFLKYGGRIFKQRFFKVVSEKSYILDPKMLKVDVRVEVNLKD